MSVKRHRVGGGTFRRWSMRLMLLFDGPDFHRSLRRFDPSLRIDYDALGRQVKRHLERRERASLELAEVRFYSGTTPVPNNGLEVFLEGLERIDAFTVPRLPHQSVGRRCEGCGEYVSVSVTFNLETEIAADLVYFAADEHCDIAVLFSSSENLSRAIRHARRLGCIVYVASWTPRRLARELSSAAYGLIDLSSEVEHFVVDQGGIQGPEMSPEEIDEIFVRELRTAMDRFSGGYVGLSYFINRWRGEGFPQDADFRRASLDRLQERGEVDVYEAHDGNMAIRLS